MKISIQSNYNVYKSKVSENNLNPSSQNVASGHSRVDCNAISSGSTKIADRDLIAMKSSVQSYVSAPADPARLEALKAKIQSSSYHIPTFDIVSSIMFEDLN